ncbi:HAMP domain-containing sensor histidine kinase [Immundisolibacter sp.]|uniref:sensor histidine kinase n=1 Tax=Immundisolibacter sp. TaxID=1934948 RepID=UPI00261B63DB|nr:HAMP domain-containing sensor histidine kinase [Immundisolibacter sp.]MDD3650271.1 HAMP domain-containing sensor histidine kinase [Immundisolibacter sp.]
MPASPDAKTRRDASAFDYLSGALGSSYRQLERRLDALQQELARQRPLAQLGEMTAGLAHQVRTPLATALVYACHLRDAPLDAAERARFAERLVERLRQLERLVADMLAYAHGAKAGDERFTLADLLHALAATVEPRRPAAASLQLPAADRGVLLTGSVENLAGALANLCLNAFEAGARQVGVERLPAGRGRLALAVVDDGPGIAPGLRGRVFEPFVSGRPGGSGLGLAVARGVIERHGGQLRLAESACGCRFEVELPAQRAWRTAPLEG